MCTVKPAEHAPRFVAARVVALSAPTARLYAPAHTPPTQPPPCAQIAGGGALPGWVLATFLANCMQDVSGCADAGRQSRHVKLLCACVALVLQRQPHALAESLPELLSFCIEVGLVGARQGTPQHAPSDLETACGRRVGGRRASRTREALWEG